MPVGGDLNIALSYLFGHEKGAFNAADTRRIGKFELAEDGTLFIDELQAINERQPEAIERVKTALQEKNPAFERVGGTVRIPFRAAAVVGMNRPFEEMPNFPSDLRYRLGIPLRLPPLREREADAWLMAQFYASQFGVTLAADVEDFVCSYDWPGNIRQLLLAISEFRGGRATADALRRVAKGGGEAASVDATSVMISGRTGPVAASPRDVAERLSEVLGYDGKILFEVVREDLRRVLHDSWEAVDIGVFVSGYRGHPLAAVRAIAECLFERVLPDAGVTVVEPAGKDGTRKAWSNNQSRVVHAFYQLCRKEMLDRGLRSDWEDLTVAAVRKRLAAVSLVASD